MKQPFQVWQFRVRDYLRRRGDTKKNRAALRKRFAEDAHALVTKLLAEHDAEREYRAVQSLTSAHMAQVLSTTALLDETARQVEEFRDRRLKDLPDDLRKAVTALLSVWEDRTVKVRHVLKPYVLSLESLEDRATKLHTEWVRATQAAREAHAALPEDIP